MQNSDRVAAILANPDINDTPGMSYHPARECKRTIRTLSMTLNCRSMYDPLQEVLLRHPRVAFRSQAYLDSHWKQYGYTSVPDFSKACADFDVLVACLESAGAQISFHDDEIDTGPDSVYVHDPAVTIGSAMLIGRMGKALRRGETESFRRVCDARNWPVLGEIQAPGILEGGDIVWLDEHTLAVGAGYRTNLEGIAQLRLLTSGLVDEIVPVPLPHFRGSGDVLHLMSLISPIGARLAVVYRPLLPVPFLEGLEAAGFELVDVSEEEFETLGCNVLALGPNLCLMADGNPTIRSRLEQVGVEVRTYPGDEISLKGQGGPTCLTRPLVRT